MSQNALKTPLFQSLNMTADARVANAMQLLGKALPCEVVSVQGQIVTVSFQVDLPWTMPQIAMPIHGSEYFRSPTQVGDKGICISVDYNIGAMSGLGSGVAVDVQPGNLSSLVFIPIGNTAFFAVNPNVATLYGPAGVTLRTVDGTVTVNLTQTGVTIGLGTSSVQVTSSEVSMSQGSSSIAVTAAGIAINGVLTINGQAFLTHEHSGVTSGTANTGGVV